MLYEVITLALSISSYIAFFAYSYIQMTDVALNDFCAAAVYAALVIVICGTKTIGTDRHARQEHAERSRLEKSSTHDYLTNTATRERLEEEARRWMSFCRRQGLPLCLVFVDLDDLKRINDRYGHVMGDNALKEVATLMKRNNFV